MEPQNPNQPGQGSNIPAPQPMEIDVRTMETDIKSFKESGGEVAETGRQSQYSTGGIDRQNNGTPGYQGAETPIFAPSGGILSQSKSDGQGLSSNAKLIMIIFGILAVAIGLGLLGYYVIFPIIFGK